MTGRRPQRLPSKAASRGAAHLDLWCAICRGHVHGQMDFLSGGTSKGRRLERSTIPSMLRRHRIGSQYAALMFPR